MSEEVPGARNYLAEGIIGPDKGASEEVIIRDGPLDEEVLDYYRELVENAEVVRQQRNPQHTIALIMDGGGFEAMYIDGQLVASAYTLQAHEVIAILANRLGLPWQVAYGTDPD